MVEFRIVQSFVAWFKFFSKLKKFIRTIFIKVKWTGGIHLMTKYGKMKMKR